MRIFLLNRVKDDSGVSGTGIIAEGCQFSNGVCYLAWLTGLKSEGRYPDIETLEKIHGHNGDTKVVWADS